MFERFTERARQVVVLAQEEARSLAHNYIGTEHILLGLLREEEGVAAHALSTLGVTLEDVRTRVTRIVGSGEEVTSGQIPFTPRAKKVLELALREALSLAHNYIETEHVLLGLMRENEGVAARVLLDCGVDAETVRSTVLEQLSDPAYRPPQGDAIAGPPRSVSRTVAGGTLIGSWPAELTWLVHPLAMGIRAELGRSPDAGDVLVLLAGADGTLAAQALAELGVDPDALAEVVNRLRGETTRTRQEHEAEVMNAIRRRLGLSQPPSAEAG